MKKIIIFALSSIFINLSLGQYYPLPTMIASAVNLEMKGKSLGSGILLKDSLSFYLVTAAHVIYNIQEKKLFSDSLYMYSYKSNPETDERDTFGLNLSNSILKKYFSYDVNADIALIYLGSLKGHELIYNEGIKRISSKPTYLNPWEISHSVSFKQFVPGLNCLMIGYPASLTTTFRFDSKRPLLRHGIIAGRDVEYQKIIIDCPSYQGNSGGPVFLQVDSSYSLLGIVSEFVPYDDILYDSKGFPRSIDYKNSGFTVVAPIGKIADLFKKLKVN